jgi:predicted MFS family arabinose efflux permease
MAITASNELFNLTFGAWLEGTFAVKIATLAAASAIIGASELSSEVMASGLVDRLGKRLAIVIGLTLNGLAALALPYLGRSLTGALIGLFLIYFTFEFTVVSSIPLMTEVLPAARATFMSTYIAAMAIGRSLGALVVPALYNPDTPQVSIMPVVLAAVFLNTVALLALRVVKTNPTSEGEPLTV